MSSTSSPPLGPTTVSPIFTWAQQTGTGTFRPPPVMTLGDSNVPGGDKHRIHRTEKHKTDLCRNWEQTGTCTFPNCTFAHGLDELRPSQKASFQPINVVEYVDELSRCLRGEVKREADLLRSTQVTNRQLEAALAKEQAARQEDLKLIDSLKKVSASLTWQIDEKNRTLAELKAKAQLACEPVLMRGDSSPNTLSDGPSGTNNGSKVDMERGDGGCDAQQEYVESILNSLNLFTPQKKKTGAGASDEFS